MNENLQHFDMCEALKTHSNFFAIIAFGSMNMNEFDGKWWFAAAPAPASAPSAAIYSNCWWSESLAATQLTKRTQKKSKTFAIVFVSLTAIALCMLSKKFATHHRSQRLRADIVSFHHQQEPHCIPLNANKLWRVLYTHYTYAYIYKGMCTDVFVCWCKNSEKKNILRYFACDREYKSRNETNKHQHQQQQKRVRKLPTTWNWLSLCQFYLFNDSGVFIVVSVSFPTDFILWPSFAVHFHFAFSIHTRTHTERERKRKR